MLHPFIISGGYVHITNRQEVLAGAKVRYYPSHENYQWVLQEKNYRGTYSMVWSFPLVSTSEITLPPNNITLGTCQSFGTLKSLQNYNIWLCWEGQLHNKQFLWRKYIPLHLCKWSVVCWEGRLLSEKSWLYAYELFLTIYFCPCKVILLFCNLLKLRLCREVWGNVLDLFTEMWLIRLNLPELCSYRSTLLSVHIMMFWERVYYNNWCHEKRCCSWDDCVLHICVAIIVLVFLSGL